MTKVLAFGSFDLLHEGHTYFLQKAASFGETLTVVIARDDTYEQIKRNKPKFSQEQRKQDVEKLPCVTEAIIGHKEDKLQVIEEVQPDIICLGYDQKAFTQNLAEKLLERNIKAKIIRLDAYKPEIYKSSKLKN